MTQSFCFLFCFYKVQGPESRDYRLEDTPQSGQAPEIRDGQSSIAYGYTNAVEYHDYRNIGFTYYSSSPSLHNNAETTYTEGPNTEHVYTEPPTMEQPNLESPNLQPVNMEPPNTEPPYMETPNLEPSNMEPSNVEPTTTVPPHIEPIYTEPASPEMTE